MSLHPSIQAIRDMALGRSRTGEPVNVPKPKGNRTVLAHMAEHLRETFAQIGQEMPRDPRGILEAAWSGISGLDGLTDTVRNALLLGFRNSGDTTQGWVTRGSLPDYRLNEIAVTDTQPRLSHVARGGTAANVRFALTDAEGWRLAKFGVQFTIDEHDLLVTGLQMDTMTLALREIGEAAGRLLPDLVYSVVLNNDTLADGTALFHADRSNYGTGGGSALSATSLGTAYGAIAGQIPTDSEGNPSHLNLVPRYLITTPSAGITARGLARDYANGDGRDLIVRTESRLTTTGLFDPLAEEAVTGADTNWLLAASEQSPSIIAAALDGQFEPTIRSGILDKNGEWGQWFDVSLALAVKAVSGRGLYFSVGA